MIKKTKFKTPVIQKRIKDLDQKLMVYGNQKKYVKLVPITLMNGLIQTLKIKKDKNLTKTSTYLLKEVSNIGTKVRFWI